MPFSQSPIEASIWTAFVGLQQWIAEAIFGTSVFKAAVVAWLGIALITTIYRIMASGAPGSALGRFGLTLGYCALGLVLLRAKSSSDFHPVDARGAAWSESGKVRATGKYRSLSSSTQGLTYYVLIHRGAAGIGDFISARVAGLFANSAHQQSPFLLLQTMAKTAGATIDDPKVMTSLEWLSENCTDRRAPTIMTATSSHSELFDLGRSECRDRYASLRRELADWARGKWGTSTWNVGEIGLEYAKAKLGFSDDSVLQNKMIASALVNTARKRMGQNVDNVHSGALLAEPGTPPMMGSGTSFFVSASNMLSAAGLTSGLFGGLTGTDFIAADQRNQSAAAYNRIVQFIPPIRGYAKGLIALAFVFAAAGLCFGTPRWMLGWFGMLAMFTVYEPLSTILYEVTMMFTKAQETTDALSALRDDPMALAGAAIIDDNLARIQAVYFGLQLSLAFVCGAGGISLFVFTRRLGGGLAGSLVSKITSTINMARSAAR